MPLLRDLQDLTPEVKFELNQRIAFLQQHGVQVDAFSDLADVLVTSDALLAQDNYSRAAAAAEAGNEQAIADLPQARAFLASSEAAYQQQVGVAQEREAVYRQQQEQEALAERQKQQEQYEDERPWLKTAFETDFAKMLKNTTPQAEAAAAQWCQENGITVGEGESARTTLLELALVTDGSALNAERLDEATGEFDPTYSDEDAASQLHARFPTAAKSPEALLAAQTRLRAMYIQSGLETRLARRDAERGDLQKDVEKPLPRYAPRVKDEGDLRSTIEKAVDTARGRPTRSPQDRMSTDPVQRSALGLVISSAYDDARGIDADEHARENIPVREKDLDDIAEGIPLSGEAQVSDFTGEE